MRPVREAPPIRPTGSPFGGKPIPSQPINPYGGGGRVTPKVFKVPIDLPDEGHNPRGGAPGEGNPGGDGGYDNPSSDPDNPSYPGTNPGGGGDGGGSGSSGGSGYGPHTDINSTRSFDQKIPMPRGNTGSPFIVPVTGPPTYKDMEGNVGAYAGPFDYWGQGGASGNRQLAGGQVFGGWSEQLKHPGFDAGTKNAIEQMGQGAIRSSYASAEDELARRAAQSGNMAGVAGAQALMGRNRASEMGKQALMSKVAEETFAAQQKESALAGLAGLYQGETQYMENLMGGRGAIAQQPFSQNTKQTGVTTGSSSTGGFSI